ncbi:MAG TPA: hypothetical protein DDY74_02685 [Pseudothermotoga sp.]|jgi:monovalent cation/proton antiporter MnhG/PhaG subunit|nr:hypothetical protein [Pseudothermotoga sp.]HBT25950.1 hypothetical protein [Pseudothermotoga sp.]
MAKAHKSRQFLNKDFFDTAFVCLYENRFEFVRRVLFLYIAERFWNYISLLFSLKGGSGVISIILVSAGLLLTFYGTVGLLRAKNTAQKLHFLGVSDTIGSVLIFTGIVINWYEVLAKIIMVSLITLITGPLISHIIARSIIQKEDRK